MSDNLSVWFSVYSEINIPANAGVTVMIIKIDMYWEAFVILINKSNNNNTNQLLKTDAFKLMFNLALDSSNAIKLK